MRESSLSWLTLFASTGTLICCALPITLVTLGLGTAVVSLTSGLPWLITLSQHKSWVFVFSALLLSISGWILYRPGRNCPTEPRTRARCNRAHLWNRRIHGLSVAIWLAGFSAAYLALPLLRWLED